MDSKESQKFLENLVYMEDNPDWEPLVASFIDQNCQVEPQLAENLSADAFQSELESKMKSVVSSFIKKYMKRLRELQGIIDLQNEETFQLKSEISAVKEENEQLNEMSLTLLSQIKKLQKYIKESDILGSILRGEIAKQKHQNKMLVNALKELYDGNEELATKILANTFSADAENPKTAADRILTSPEAHYKRHNLSLIPGENLPTDKGFRTSASAYSARSRRRAPGGQSVGELFESERAYSVTEGPASLGEEQIKEAQEFEQTYDFERKLNEALMENNEEGENEELYSFEETGNEMSDKIGSITLGRGSDYVSPSLSISDKDKKSPPKFLRKVTKVKSLFYREDGSIGKSIFDFDNLVEPSSATFAFPELELVEEDNQFPVKKLERVPKWLRSQKNKGKENHKKANIEYKFWLLHVIY